MSIPKNIINNNELAQLSRKAGPQVVGAIRDAAAKTGVNFAYLMEKAAAESNFDVDAKARTSSASGLFQFIESTWLSMVKKHGHKYGLAQYADKIGDNGRVADAKTRKEILSLRNDPETASYMAAEFASDNERYLRSNVKGEIGSTELYFAHFMGAAGGAAFLNAMKRNPMQNAADLFPKAAAANRNVFFDSKTGKPRTLAGVYAFFDRKFDNSPSANAIGSRYELAGAKALNVQNIKANGVSTGERIAMNRITTIDHGRGRLEHIIWNDEPRTAGRMPVFNNRGAVAMDPVQIMMMAELSAPGRVRR